jgi:hypothetical protein
MRSPASPTSTAATRRVLGALVGGALIVRAAPARADLHDEALRLAEAWKAEGASVIVDAPRFLDEGEPDRDRHTVVVMPELPEGECTTVVLLGSRGLGFHVKLADLGGDEPQVKRITSVAGAVAIERCGEAAPQRILVSSDSGRGAFETIAARSAKPLPPLRVALPERTGGTVLPALEPGTLPVLPPPEKRAEIAEARARRDGATIATRSSWETGPDRTGLGEDTLAPGCHVLQLFAVDPRTLRPGSRGRLDLDAEMRDADDERLVARDRSDAPDATLSKCVGATTRVEVTFAGATAGSTVLVTHFTWPLPDHLPALWGDDAKARMGHVLLVRHLPALRQDAIMLAQGGYGLTPVPLSLEAGGCYVAVATLVKEQARSIGLRVRVGATDAGDDRGIDDDGAAVAFCAGDTTHATAVVEARGTPLLGWGLALYRLQSGVWGPPR